MMHLAPRRIGAQVAAGDYSLKVPSEQANEIGFLARAFNDMVESLHGSHSRLEGWIATLERKVSEKAHELRSAQSQVIQAEKLSSVGLMAGVCQHNAQRREE